MNPTSVVDDQGYSREAGTEALLAASRSVNPYFSKVEVRVDPEWEELYNEILHEVQNELGVESLDDRDTKIQARSLITNWMSELTLEGADREALQDQLGWRGELDPIYYDIEIADSLKKQGPTIGVRPNHVRSALRSPDGHSHYNPDAEDEEQAISLFTEHHQSGRFTLLIQGFRNGDKITAHNAFRVYYDDVEAGEYIRSPKEYLHALVDAYGLPLRIGNEWRKLFWFEEVSHPEESDRTKEFEVQPPEDHEVWHSAFLKQTEDNIFVAQAFAIDVTEYRRDLREHGVQFSD